MPKCYLRIVGLLALLALATVRGLAQTIAESDIRLPSPTGQASQAPATGLPAPADLAPAVNLSPQAPPADQAPHVPAVDRPPTPPAKDASPAGGDADATGAPITLEDSTKAPPVTSLSDFMGYRYSAGGLEWIPGTGDQFGMFSIAWDHYQKAGIDDGLGGGLAVNFLSGPDQTDMPARTYDFSLAYQIRKRVGPLAFDACAAVLAAADFKGSARKGILFPSHAVGYLNVNPAVDVVFGVDYLDRGDVKILPVAGLIYVPTPEMRFEVVFPRPRVVFQLADRYRLYLSGELGGDTWAVCAWPWATTWPPTTISASASGWSTRKPIRPGLPSRSATCSIAAWNTPPALATCRSATR